MNTRFASKSFYGKSSGYNIFGIRVELAGSDISLTSVGCILSVVSVLFIFGFEN